MTNFSECIIALNENEYLGSKALTTLGGKVYIDKDLILLTNEERKTFMVIYVIILIIGFIANVAVIISITRRKNRYIQKTCIISLALSDLFALISMEVNNLETFSHPMINWTLGKFLCGAIPFCQVYAILVSSFSLLMIAMDRYRNVVHALNNQWNPQKRSCIVGAFLLWIFCGAISYPMSTYFTYMTTHLLITDGHNNIIDCKLYHFCMSLEKQTLMKYHISITCIIFFPMLVTFMWFYYNIAMLIWRHRKPASERSDRETSMTRSTEVTSRNDLENSAKGFAQKKRNLHVERKIRTLKIIITLILVFIICRLPYWIYFALKNYISALDGHWIINYTMICLSLLNCALNPFLYTFLRPTVNSLGKIMRHMNEFLCQICCCCFSSEDLNDFEKEDKQFGFNYHRKPTMRIVNERFVKIPDGGLQGTGGGNHECIRY